MNFLERIKNLWKWSKIDPVTTTFAYEFQERKEAKIINTSNILDEIEL